MHPLLRPDGAAAPGRGAQLRRLGHGRGLLAGAVQLRLLAGWRRGGRLLLLRLPAPDGFAEAPVGPDGAFYSADFQQFLLPYETARAAPDPDRAVAEFLRTTYAAAADLGRWDRSALEDDPLRWA
nr:DUF5996 family protein [Pseudonocardia sp. AL041005-10]